MNVLLRDLAQLISVPSFSGQELDALRVFEQLAGRLGVEPERIPISLDRYNLFYSFGVPRVVFTSHIDVVPAED